MCITHNKVRYMIVSLYYYSVISINFDSLRHQGLSAPEALPVG